MRLIQSLLLLAFMIILFIFDPFNINHRIIESLRMKYVIFTKEPRLLFYTYTYIGSFIAKVLAILAIIALLWSQRVKLDEDLGVKGPSSDGWKRLVIPFALVTIALRYYQAMDPLTPNLPVRLVFPEANAFATIIIMFSIIFLAPVTEEIIFRGYFFGVFKKSFGAVASIIITSLIFALAHAPQMDFSITGVGVILAIGLLLGYFRQKYDSVLIPIIFHGVYNSVYIAVGAINFLRVGY
jgi:membrane protease YdiL (CAAX protease family)